MKTMSTKQFVAYGLLCIALAVLLPSCSVFGPETGTCTTTCFSRSTGNNLGTVSYSPYTRDECREALENRETILTQCTMSWN